MALIRFHYPGIPEPLDLIAEDPDGSLRFDKFVQVWHELEWLLRQERKPGYK